MERKLTTILAADVVGYSAMMEKDEAGTYDRTRTRRKELFEPEVVKYRGRVFKLMGDGILAEFASVVDAVECAVSIQRAMAQRNSTVPENESFDVRIGINVGEVIVEGDDLYGEGVNIAARLEQIAAPGGICVSGKVAREVEKRVAFAFRAMGDHKVKNIAEPVQVYAIDPQGAQNVHGPGIARRTSWRGAAVAALLVTLVAGALAFALHGPVVDVALNRVTTIAVLPFDNMSDDSKLTYFSDGVSEDIISMLARAPDVTVVARNSSFIYKGKATDVREIGKALGVDFVLEGSVRKDADKVRIVAQLIDAKSGNHVWADRFDETGTDPMALQDHVTGKIVGALAGDKGQLKLAQYRQSWGKDKANIGEYDYYLRGHEYYMRFTRVDNEEAGRIWREGFAKYPNSPLLMIKLGWYHYIKTYSGWSENLTEDRRLAGEWARKGMSNPALTPYQRRTGEWLLSYVYASEGNFEKSISAAEAAIALSPRDPRLIGDVAQMAIWAGLTDKALAWTKYAIQIDSAHTTYFYAYLGWELIQKGEYREALAALVQETDMTDWQANCLRVIAHIRLGEIDEAQKAAKLVVSSFPTTFTAGKWKELNFAVDPSTLDRDVADLVKAGLPP